MRKEEIIETPIWGLYLKGRDYHSRHNIYSDTARNHRFYNGNQWEGVKLEGVEPVQENFIRTIVKFKTSVIHDNLYEIVYSSENYDNPQFAPVADEYCKMLNRYAARVWEKDKMDQKGRSITKDAAINDEGILYVDFDKKSGMPVNTVIDKDDVYYGNENEPNIELQPYILVRRRLSVSEAVDLAKQMGVGGEKLKLIVGDKVELGQNTSETDDEVNANVTVIYKLYKKSGVTFLSIATRYCEIINDSEIGITRYPLAHFIWEKKRGSARGEGEVRNLIPNQIEVNKTAMRRVITVKNHAYQQKVIDASKFDDTSAFDGVGGVIETNGNPIEDVNKAVSVIHPSSMSGDVVALEEGLIKKSRELSDAGEAATGSINPENASGKAILAVQQAQRAPLSEQKERYKNFVEDVALIWLDYVVAHSAGGFKLEKAVTDEDGKNERIEIQEVLQATLKELKATVKIDVTPKSPFDKLAQEQTLENFLTGGWFNPSRLPELKAYVMALDDDSTTPKNKLLKMIANAEAEQEKIMRINAKAQLLKQNIQRRVSQVPPEFAMMAQ